MSDLISNTDVLETYAEILEGLYEIKNWKCGGDAKMHAVIEAAIKALEAIEVLKSTQPEPQWIPCSERLPEDYTDVLVWFEYFRYGNYNCLYQMHGIGSYSSEYDSWLINQETGWNELKVFAWMPLPEPYKGEQC